MALPGAVSEAVTGCWLSGCWATFIGFVFPLEWPHLTPVYGRLTRFFSCDYILIESTTLMAISLFVVESTVSRVAQPQNESSYVIDWLALLLYDVQALA